MTDLDLEYTPILTPLAHDTPEAAARLGNREPVDDHRQARFAGGNPEPSRPATTRDTPEAV